jgi:shikimate kinase
MCTAAWLPELAEHVDPRLREAFVRDVRSLALEAPLPRPGHVVLVGHRAAGKTHLVAPIAHLLRRHAIDLDALIAARTGRPARELLAEGTFRRAEREAFAAVTGAAVIAAGGGFLSHHADLLEGHTAVLVPVTFETYRARLRADTSRPRLRPELTLEAEIEAVFREREALHARVPTVPLARLVASLGVSP